MIQPNTLDEANSISVGKNIKQPGSNTPQEHFHVSPNEPAGLPVHDNIHSILPIRRPPQSSLSEVLDAPVRLPDLVNSGLLSQVANAKLPSTSSPSLVSTVTRVLDSASNKSIFYVDSKATVSTIDSQHPPEGLPIPSTFAPRSNLVASGVQNTFSSHDTKIGAGIIKPSRISCPTDALQQQSRWTVPNPLATFNSYAPPSSSLKVTTSDTSNSIVPQAVQTLLGNVYPSSLLQHPQQNAARALSSIISGPYLKQQHQTGVSTISARPLDIGSGQSQSSNDSEGHRKMDETKPNMKSPPQSHSYLTFQSQGTQANTQHVTPPFQFSTSTRHQSHLQQPFQLQTAASFQQSFAPSQSSEGTTHQTVAKENEPRFPRVATTFAEMKAQQQLMKQRQQQRSEQMQPPSQVVPKEVIPQLQTILVQPKQEPQLLREGNQQRKVILTQDGKQALAKAVLSILQSPSGTIDMFLVKNAAELTGLTEETIISAANNARQREYLRRMGFEKPATDAKSCDPRNQLIKSTGLESAPSGSVESNSVEIKKTIESNFIPLSWNSVEPSNKLPRNETTAKLPPVIGTNTGDGPVTTPIMGAAFTSSHNIFSNSKLESAAITHSNLGTDDRSSCGTPHVSIVAVPTTGTSLKASVLPVLVGSDKGTVTSDVNPSKLSKPLIGTGKVTSAPFAVLTSSLPSKTALAVAAAAQAAAKEQEKWKRVQSGMFLSNNAIVKGINFSHKVSVAPSWTVAPLSLGAVVRCSNAHSVLDDFRKHMQRCLKNGTDICRRKYLLLREVTDIQNRMRTKNYFEVSPVEGAVSHHLKVSTNDISTKESRTRYLFKTSSQLLDVTDKYKRIKMQPRKEGKLLDRNLRKYRVVTCDNLSRKVKEINKHILSHSSEFFKFHRNRKSELSRLARSVRDHFAVSARRKEKDEELAERARISALRANDIKAYTALLEETRNERLKFLLDKTDNFMNQISGRLQDNRQQEGSMCNRVSLSANQSYYSSAHVTNEIVKQPSILVGGSLKEYQLAGLHWLVSLYNNRLNGILADEMGLGKTIQTIALISYLMEFKDNRGPYLVIVPLSTMSNWVNEFRRWCPSATVVVYKGTAAQRKDLYKEEVREGHFNVLLTTYEYIIRDKASLRKNPWQYAIVDEGHRMKNAQSKFSVTLGTQYKTSYRLLLTGTPLQNSLPELWSLLNFLLPNIFNSVETFDQWFNKPFAQFNGSGSENNGEEILSNEERLLIINRLHELLRPFMLRRVKSDVLDQLPDKIERVLRCELSSWQKALYRQISYKILENGVKTSTRGLNNVAMQLRKVCNHPYMFSHEGYYINDDLIRTSGKVELLDRMLPKLKAGGHRILMFFQMTGAMTILEDYFKYRGYLSLRLDGSTPGEEREKRMALFNAVDSPYFIFMLSTRAGGLGLNLASADTVIIFDSDWNPMMDLQAQDRAHRIGQKRIVIVFRLISNSPVEEKILSRATEKLNMSEIIVEAGKFDKSSVEEDNSLERLKLMELLLTDFDSSAPKTAATTTLLSSDDEGEQYPDGDEGETEVELNELLSRNDDDYELYRKIDSGEHKSDDIFTPVGLFTDPNDVPDWIKYPNGKPNDASGQDILAVRRAAKMSVSYSDNLSEHKFMKLMEEKAQAEEEASKMRKQLWHEKRTSNINADTTSKTYENEKGLRSVDNAVVTSLNRNLLSEEVYERLISICKSVISLKEEKTKRRRSDIFREKPCPHTYPDYYNVIKHPIGINDIMRKCRSRSYSSVTEYLQDWSVMFANAKIYNGEGSWVVADAEALNAELDRLVVKNNLSDLMDLPKKDLRIKLSIKKVRESTSKQDLTKRKVDSPSLSQSNKKGRLLDV